MTAASASPVTDPVAPSASMAAPGIADKVRAQLLGDYPASALSWIDGIRWTGPVQVPVSQVDRTSGDTDWAAAAKDKVKLALFQHKIAGGFRKPVVLIRRPGNPKLFAVDGHTRVLACTALGVPVAAWVGTAASEHGPWEQAHSRQLANDSGAVDLATAPGLTSRSGMISLDLPEGTIQPVPGGLDDHHVTVVYLGPDLDDDAFAAACDRAKDAAATASGPLTGTVSGVDSFTPSPGSEGKVPAFAPASIPGAKDLRSKLEDLSASEHKDWVPHVTLAYVSKGDPLPAPVPSTSVKFTHLSVHRGDEVKRFQLGGGSDELAGETAGIELSADVYLDVWQPSAPSTPIGTRFPEKRSAPPRSTNARTAVATQRTGRRSTAHQASRQITTSPDASPVIPSTTGIRAGTSASATREPGSPSSKSLQSGSGAAKGRPLSAASSASRQWQSTRSSRAATGAGSQEHPNPSIHGSVELSARTPYLSATHEPFGSPSGPGLWRVKGMQLPAYVQQIAHALLRTGRAADESSAIQLAVGAIQRWARGGGKVSPEVRAAAAKALAEWEALRAAAHAHANDSDAIDLAGMFTESLHPRIGGKFASKGGTPVAQARARNAPKGAAPAILPGGTSTRSQQLRYQASQDRQLAHQVMIRIAALVRARDAAIAGISPGKAKAPVNAAKSAAAKKAALTRKTGTAKAKAKTASAKPKKTRVQRLNGQIRLLKNDARLLLKAANHLDTEAAKS